MSSADPATQGVPSDQRNIAIWLILCSGMVAVMVVIGGITRLTESGLSMTEWRPLIGFLPPLGEAEWERVFELYRRTSEFRLQNPGMDLAGFKTIFWWEYIHRLWGRMIGLAFGLPLLWFFLRHRIDRRLLPHLFALFLLGALQGLIGWWMVKSGFVDRDDVSQYRLTVHLALAFAVLGYMLWLVFGLLRPDGRIAVPASIRRHGYAVLCLAFLTILSGGLVAGSNAGMIHNTWPLMDDGLVPDDVAALTPFWLNLFENHATIQFDHRIMAYVTALTALAYWLRVRRAGIEQRVLAAAVSVVIAVAVQLVVGISTLLLVVPLSLGVLHQAVAIGVFALALWNAWAISSRGTPASRRTT